MKATFFCFSFHVSICFRMRNYSCQINSQALGGCFKECLGFRGCFFSAPSVVNVLTSILYTLVLCGANPRLTLGERQVTPWTGCQSVTGLTCRDKQPFMLTFTPTGNQSNRQSFGLWEKKTRVPRWEHENSEVRATDLWIKTDKMTVKWSQNILIHPWWLATV